MERVEYVCPACRQSILAPVSLKGHAVPCPKCSKMIDGWPAPKYIPSVPPIPDSSLPEPGLSGTAQGHHAALAAWLGVSLVALVTLCGVFAVLFRGEENRKMIEAEIKETERVATTHVMYYTDDARLKLVMGQLHSALEKDQRDRRQAVASLLFAGVFEAAALGIVGVLVNRRRSLYQNAILMGSFGAGSFGLIGVLVSQFSPVFGGFLAKRFTVPFAPHQLALLVEHTLAFGLAGLLIGAGLSILRSRATHPATVSFTPEPTG